MTPAELQAALAQLPHGVEFRFLDHLTELVPGTRGSGQYRIRHEAEFLRGHFPGAPLMPGVLMIEAIAQLAGVVAQSDPIHGALPGLKLTSVRGAKILGAARPGELLEVNAEIIARLGILIQARGQVRRGALLLAQAEVTLSGEKPES